MEGIKMESKSSSDRREEEYKVLLAAVRRYEEVLRNNPHTDDDDVSFVTEFDVEAGNHCDTAEIIQIVTIKAGDASRMRNCCGEDHLEQRGGLCDECNHCGICRLRDGGHLKESILDILGSESESESGSECE